MKRCSLILILSISLISGYAQSLELIDRQDAYQAAISEILQIPIKIKNTSDKSQFYIIRKISADLSSSQKGYFCLDKNCLEQGMDEFSKKLEPGETVENLFYTIETGLVTGQNNLRFEVFARATPQQAVEHNVLITIEEKRVKSLVFQHKDISLNDVYPNPVSDQAFIDYKIHNESVKARIVIHNILGRTMTETELPNSETKIKIQADDLATGIYFYTLYLDNEGVLTRKLVVRK